MRTYITVLAMACPLMLSAQLGIGLKAGVNFANVTSASSINSSSRSGFVAGAFLAPASKSIISSRTELLYSRQGYSFKSGTSTGNVNLDYIVLPQFMAINITKYVQLQFGAQMAFLLNAKADSTTTQGNTGPYANIMSYYNKFDYGLGAGIELHPVAGWLIGARYNLGLGKIYSSLETGQMPTFTAADAKNNLVSVFTGWIFGGDQGNKHKNKKPKPEQ